MPRVTECRRRTCAGTLPSSAVPTFSPQVAQSASNRGGGSFLACVMVKYSTSLPRDFLALRTGAEEGQFGYSAVVDLTMYYFNRVASANFNK